MKIEYKKNLIFSFDADKCADISCQGQKERISPLNLMPPNLEQKLQSWSSILSLNFIYVSALWDKPKSFWDIFHFPMSKAVSEQASEQVSAVECASKVSSLDWGTSEKVSGANNSANEQASGPVLTSSWLFWTTVHVSELNINSVSELNYNSYQCQK